MTLETSAHTGHSKRRGLGRGGGRGGNGGGGVTHGNIGLHRALETTGVGAGGGGG